MSSHYENEVKHLAGRRACLQMLSKLSKHSEVHVKSLGWLALIGQYTTGVFRGKHTMT